MQKFELIKLTSYHNTCGIISLSGAASPMLAAKEIVSSIGDKLSVTQLYRVSFEDNEICTTMKHADINPVVADIVVVEISFSCILIFADLGAMCINIMLDVNVDENVELTQEYKEFEWIKRASDETIKAICKMAITKIPDSKNDLKQATESIKTE